jgi:hypothetical protein
VLLVKASLPSFCDLCERATRFAAIINLWMTPFSCRKNLLWPSDKVIAPRKIKLLLLAIYLQCMDVSGSRRRSQYLVDKILARIHNKVNRVLVILLRAGQFHLENRML